MSSPIDDVDVYGKVYNPKLCGVLSKRFGQPPFTVLDARKGDWLDRKAAWLRMGIRSEHARGVDGTSLVRPIQIENNNFYQEKTELERRLGRQMTTAEAHEILVEEGKIKPIEKGFKKDLNLGGGGESPMDRQARYAGKEAKTDEASAEYNSSHFDPVLCEMMYRWYCPPGGVISDPFAGSSVSGMMAAHLGYHFWGMDLSPGQVECNRRVVDTLPPGAPKPVWVQGDSAASYAEQAPKVDFAFTCPPYHDLEVYSEEPNDLSRMDWDDFRSAYDQIVANVVDRLKDDRFAGVVIGDVRGPDGNLRNLPAFTTSCFRRHGMHLYNEAVLVTAVGSLSVRTGSQFEMTRKFGKSHQNVFVYLKGDAKKATDAVTGLEYKERRRLYDEAVKKRTSAQGWDKGGE